MHPSHIFVNSYQGLIALQTFRGLSFMRSLVKRTCSCPSLAWTHPNPN
jgi:hypothetical protein